MREVVRDVYLMEGMRGANVYLLVSSEGLTLVDSGLAGDAEHIVAQLEGAGYAVSALSSIVLTHWHGDHTGNAAELARRSGAQVVAHREEVSLIEKTQPVPSASLAQRLLNALVDHVLFRRAPCKVDRPVRDGDVLEALGGMCVLHTPGHSPGSICLYQPERRILFCGDVLFNQHPITGRRRLGRYMRSLTLDNAQAREDVVKLPTAALEVLCCGHGAPVLVGAGEQIERLLQEGRC
jgi:glyoxylase-like metal-dependent hydrolase (beta-lactamase superfamily II)